MYQSAIPESRRRRAPFEVEESDRKVVVVEVRYKFFGHNICLGDGLVLRGCDYYSKAAFDNLDLKK